MPLDLFPNDETKVSLVFELFGINPKGTHWEDLETDTDNHVIEMTTFCALWAKNCETKSLAPMDGGAGLQSKWTERQVKISQCYTANETKTPTIELSLPHGQWTLLELEDLKKGFKTTMENLLGITSGYHHYGILQQAQAEAKKVYLQQRPGGTTFHHEPYSKRLELEMDEMKRSRTLGAYVRARIIIE